MGKPHFQKTIAKQPVVYIMAPARVGKRVIDVCLIRKRIVSQPHPYHLNMSPASLWITFLGSRYLAELFRDNTPLERVLEP
jgi:hypothetical protein